MSETLAPAPEDPETAPAETPVPASTDADAEQGSEQDGDGTPVDAEGLRVELAAAREEVERYRATAKETREALKAARTPEEFAAVQTQVTELEHELHRERLGRQYGLPQVVTDLITGEDADAREAHAKALAAAFHQRGTGVGRGGLDPTERPVPRDPAALAASIPRRRH
ncbi:hypothetical protein I5Q34_19865 [Streptomyces sp. AV19]|uniref:hypothetical protein n=1 Tax=Streptomyces sp. AV19 TaxID=2793068 RepID=UPI0018FE36EE|nr:hypothetical protein [Streptomyces sp. AV19]MBH1936506.1 hypothetical protein [Streptomyces sp. AV19]MDG4532563.1 hypothetical protein [Streptomyces sp. AV19]